MIYVHFKNSLIIHEEKTKEITVYRVIKYKNYNIVIFNLNHY